VKSRSLLAVLVTLFVACDRVDSPVAPNPTLTPTDAGVAAVGPGGTLYSGRATTVDINVLGLVNKKLCDTGNLPSSGGHITNSLLNHTIPNLLHLKVLYCITKGGNQQSISESSVLEVILLVGGHVIFADALSSMAAARCNNGVASTSGSSSIARLNVNGTAHRISGAPNQIIPLINGYIVVNEQTGFTNPGSASKTVTSLRVVINKPLPQADVKFSRSHADIDCGPA
jgi:hypothetical protein